MIPRWIVEVFNRELPNMKGGERDRLAEALCEAAAGSPALQSAIISAIRISAREVLKSRHIQDGRGDIAGEVARNAATNVIHALAEG